MRCLLFTIVLALSAMALSAADFRQEITSVLKQQEMAWNQGNLREFLLAYLPNGEITFVGKTVTRGMDAIRQRYETNYGSPEKMGTLRFDELEIRSLGRDYALVLGRFQLARTAAGGGDASGRFTLVAKRTRQGWKFIHDHTSS